MINAKVSDGRIGNIHPGEILQNEFLLPLRISAYKLAKDTNMPQTRVSENIKGERSITCNTALKFAKYFNTSPDFWIGLQNDYDMEEELQKVKDELERIEPCCV